MKRDSWKGEFDRKYNQLMDIGDIKIMDSANAVLCKALDELDQIIKTLKAKKAPDKNESSL